MKIYSFSIQGKRESNEDQHYVVSNLDNSDSTLNNINFIGVFDGHGGKLVSKYLRDNLPIFFIKKFKNSIFLETKTFTKYIIKIFNLLQDKLKKDHPRAVIYCGSTCCLSIHCTDAQEKKSFLWIINVGDSRAILANKDNIGVQLSNDHKPNNPEEKKRIEDLGGNITFDGVDWRVKNLSLSRAFGDIDCTPYVTHLPQIYKYKLSQGDKFIVQACDGLWDVLSNQDVVDFVLDLQIKNYKGNFAKALCNYAYKKGSLDNITCVVYIF
jgi:serine/threonine protein phosphatase PrpC